MESSKIESIGMFRIAAMLLGAVCTAYLVIANTGTPKTPWAALMFPSDTHDRFIDIGRFETAEGCWSEVASHRLTLDARSTSDTCTYSCFTEEAQGRDEPC